MSGGYAEYYKCQICDDIVKFKNIDQEPWTGIYCCKGERHSTQFYCGVGKCAQNRKRKIRTCDDLECVEYDKEFTLDIKKIHFNRIKNELITCLLCHKSIVYTQYHKHIKSECKGEEEQEEENKKDNIEEEKKEDENNQEDK